MTPSAEVPNLRKVAILLASLGTDTATSICQHLPKDMVRQVAETIAHLGPVDHNEQGAVLSHFAQTSRRILSIGGIEYARSLLAQTTGESPELYEEVESGLARLRALADTEPHILWRNIQDETPQVIAVIISQLPPTKAANLLQFMDEQQRGDVAYRAANLGPLAPGALEALAESIDSDAVRPESSDQEPATSGTDFILQVFEHLDRSSEKELLEVLSNIDNAFAEQINDQLVTFDSLFMLDDRFMQVLLREVDSATLAVALKSSDEHQRERVMKNLSERAREALEQETEVLGAVKVTDVDAAQKEIVNIARRLDEAEQITLREEQVEYIE